MNWFRKDEDGEFPVAGLRRELARARVDRAPLRRRGRRAWRRRSGLLARPEDLDTTGLDLDPATLARLLSVDLAAVALELPQVRTHLEGIDHLPAPVLAQLELLEAAVATA